VLKLRKVSSPHQGCVTELDFLIKSNILELDETLLLEVLLTLFLLKYLDKRPFK